MAPYVTHKESCIFNVEHTVLDWQMDWSQAEKNEYLLNDKLYVVYLGKIIFLIQSG